MPSAGHEQDRQAITVPAEMLREMIGRTIFAVSSDETRLNLSGILFERVEPHKLRMVATDGHRLSMITRTVEGGNQAPGVIVPRKGVLEISKMIETAEQPVTMSVQSGVAHASCGQVELSMRLVEGEFPDYKQVIPPQSTRRMTVSAEALLAALRRVSIVSSERTRGVKLQLDPGKLEISSINPDVGEATEELSVEYQGEGLSIGFNAKYMIDLLGALSGSSQVEVGFNDEVSPGVLRCESDADYVYVVMPMRL